MPALVFSPPFERIGGGGGGVPPTTPAGDPGTFTLTSSTSGTLPFALGLVFRQGDIPAGQDVAFSGATAKATILSTWPDGSARIALAAGTYSSSGSAVTVTPSAGSNAAGTALTGASVQAAMGANTAVIDCGSYGTATWSGADFASPFKTHAATSAFGEFIYRKAVGSDAHLVAWIAVRLWSSGAVEVLPWMENGYVNVASPTSKSATFAFSLGGTSRFSAAIDLPARCRTPLVSGSTLSHWLGTDPGVTPTHDTVYLQQTALVPAYQPVTPDASLFTSLPSTYTPLQQGLYRTTMSDTGYHPSIGLLPQWDVLHLLTPTAQTFGAVVRQAYSAGRYASHYRDESTNRPIRLTSHPTATISTAAAASGTAAPVYDTGHHPSMGYLAYLLTGRFYFMEEVQFLATYNYLRQQSNVTTIRQQDKGLFLSASGDCTVRGAAWCNRTLAQAAIVSPDGDAVGTDLKTSLEENIAWNHARYVAQANNQFGLVEPYSSSYGSANGHQIEAPWQQDFYTAAFGFMLAAQPSISSTALTKLSAFFAWKAQWIVGRLGMAGASNYLYADAAQYNLEVCATGADFGTGAGPWPASWATIYGWNFVTSNTTDPGSLRGGNFPGAASYWGNLHPAIAYAVKHGVTGAEGAYNLLIGASNATTQAADFATAPEWAVAPLVLPAYAPAAGAVTNIQINDITADASYQVNTWYTQGRGVSQYFVNWSGGAFNPSASYYGALMMWGGGHGGGLNLKALVFDFTSRKFSGAGPENPASDYTGGPPNLPGLDATWSDYNTGTDYIVPGLHSYNFLTYAPANADGVGAKGALVISLNVPSAVTAAPHFIDLATNRMSRAAANVGVNGTGYGAGGVYDSRRKRYWWTPAGETVINMLDWTETHPRTLHTSTLPGGASWAANAYYALFRYIPEADLALGLWCEYGSNVVKGEVWDMSTSPPTRLAQLVLPSYPNGNGGAGDILSSSFGWDWCPITRAAYLYMGFGSTTVWKLKPSSLALASATWTWSTETFTGAAYNNPWPVNNGEGPFSKWSYVPGLRAFCWAWSEGTYSKLGGGSTTGVMQLWRPSGT